MREFEYLTLDVFTGCRFGGNPLAVLPEADGLSAADMQKIAAEFNYSETAFVSASQQGLGPRVRIFTPKGELPFAGHPTVGTAIALKFLAKLNGDEVVFEEAAGPVDLRFSSGGKVTFRAPGPASLEPFSEAGQAAKSLSLNENDVLGQPILAGAGLNFPFIELRSLEGLARARMSAAATPFREEAAAFCDLGEGRLRMRVFAPGHGIVEDPATGSAAAGLAVVLASRSEVTDGTLEWSIDQGIEMGRPSEIAVSALKKDGLVEAVYVTGSAVVMAQGRMRIE